MLFLTSFGFVFVIFIDLFRNNLMDLNIKKCHHYFNLIDFLKMYLIKPVIWKHIGIGPTLMGAVWSCYWQYHDITLQSYHGRYGSLYLNTKTHIAWRNVPTARVQGPRVPSMGFSFLFRCIYVFNWVIKPCISEYAEWAFWVACIKAGVPHIRFNW